MLFLMSTNFTLSVKHIKLLITFSPVKIQSDLKYIVQGAPFPFPTRILATVENW